MLRYIVRSHFGSSANSAGLMTSRSAKIDKICRALHGASAHTLDQITDLLDQDQNRRVLKPTLSEAVEEETNIAAALDLGPRQKRRRLAGVMNSSYRVACAKTSAKFACEQWTNDCKDYHPSLFLLTILIRIAYGSIKGLRDYAANNQWALIINEQPLYKSVLFRSLYDNGHKRMDMNMFNTFTKVMAVMHVHNVFAPQDAFHRAVAPALALVTGFAAKLARLSFYYSFSFITLWADDARALDKLYRMSPASFARWCWTQHAVPVTNRYGIGADGAKTSHSILMRSAGRDRTTFLDTIIDQCNACITFAEAKTLEADMQKATATGARNRMQVLNSFFDNRRDGDFARKNTAEVMSAQGLIVWSSDELLHLKNGPGASRYWSFSQHTRPEHMHIVRTLYSHITSVKVEWTRRSPLKLAFPSTDLDDEVGQFWACAQTRILRLREKLVRGASSVVPYGLLPNKVLKQRMHEAWAAAPECEDSASDSD